MGIWRRLRSAGTVAVLAAAISTQVVAAAPAQAAPLCTPVGAIGDAWRAAGGNASPLGPCTANQGELLFVQWETFQNGIIFWTPFTGAFPFLWGAPVAASTGVAALAQAETQLGVPYVWGGNQPRAWNTPGGFDCSGLTQWAFRQVGVTIPRVAADQARSGSYVPREQLQPGDLVFFYSPVSHVGIYAGNNRVLNAPTEGRGVEYTNISYMPYNTARRY